MSAAAAAIITTIATPIATYVVVGLSTVGGTTAGLGVGTMV